jgi:anti-anti-sigma factor
MIEQLLLRECRESSAMVLTVSGELDLVTAGQLDRQLSGMVAVGRLRVVLDLTDLTFCDAYGIRVLIRGRKRVDERGGWLRLLAAGPRVRLVLDIAHLTRLLPVFDTLEHALDGVEPQPVDASVRSRR